MRGDITLSQEEAHRAKIFGEVAKGVSSGLRCRVNVGLRSPPN